MEFPVSGVSVAQGQAGFCHPVFSVPGVSAVRGRACALNGTVLVHHLRKRRIRVCSCYRGTCRIALQHPLDSVLQRAHLQPASARASSALAASHSRLPGAPSVDVRHASRQVPEPSLWLHSHAGSLQLIPLCDSYPSRDVAIRAHVQVGQIKISNRDEMTADPIGCSRSPVRWPWNCSRCCRSPSG